MSTGNYDVKRWHAALRIFMIVGVAVFLFAVSPKDCRWIPCCPFYWATGLYCSGCGTLRGLHELFHGNVVRAAKYNIMVFVLVPVAIGVLTSEVAILLRGRPLSLWRCSARECRILVVVLVLHFVLRNIPVYPFRLLAPH